MTKWVPHYTGIETCEQDLIQLRLRLYRQRDRKTGKLRFIRLSLGRRSIGAFIGRTNYGNRLFASGVELFTNGFALVLGRRKPRSRAFSTHTSGSMVEPFTATVAALGPVGIAFNSPKWLIRLYRRRSERQWAAMAEEL